MNRRDFLKMTALGTTGLMSGWVLGCSQTQAATALRRRQPNVIFIICDDLNDSIAGMGGHPQAKTPNVNQLMRRGVRFTNAQCNNPLCGPSRASLWSGLYPSTTGYYGYRQGPNHWRNNHILYDVITTMEHFTANGYNVYGTGKVFHNNHEDFNIWYRQDGFKGYGITASHGPWPWNGAGRPKAGYGAWGHPSMPKAYHESSFRSFAPLSDVPDVPADPKKGIPGYRGWTLHGKPFRYVSENDRDLMPDELSANWVKERLGEKQQKPFFMVVGFNRPHTPMYAPKKYFDMFALKDIQLPPYLKNDLDDCAEILKDSEGRRHFDKLMANGGVGHWRKWIQAYLACVAFVGDQVGKVLDALENSPYADNTIVVVTSDHGYHMGEKDNLFKLTVWEEATRVPLVVYAPGVTRSNTECEHPVSLVDMYPTLIDLCGLGKNPNARINGVALDGHSIVPFLKDPKNGTWDGPSVALSVIYGLDELKRNEPGRPERQHFTVRSKRWRYTLCNSGEEELYDHKNDPQEWTNLAKDPKYAEIKKELRRELCRLAKRP